MLSRLKAHLYAFDWIIVAAVSLLVAFGLIEIYSVALGRESLDLINFHKQIIFVAAGFVLMFAASFIDYYFLRSVSRYVYVFGALILIAVLIFGQTVRGTKGWFNLFGFGLQPVEFIKIILILFLSDYFSSLATKVKTTKHFLISAFFTFILAGLVMLQPDFGSALILLAIWLVLVIAADFNLKYLISVALVGVVLFSSAWFFFFKDYQKERIQTFLNPTANSLESGYNISQAIIAIGSGGLTGKGVGFGSQSQLKFLPEAQNDFIFAVIAEELGLLGVVLVLSFYFILFFRCFRILKDINNDFGIYFLIGSGSLIFIQMFINIGMNLGIMPVVGLSLPFISYGGSSLLSLMIIIGIMQNIIIKSRSRY